MPSVPPRPPPPLPLLPLVLPPPAPGPAQKAKPAAPPSPPAPVAEKLQALEFRSLGPAIMGGRIDDFAVGEPNPSIFYVGTASGGIFKTLNRGVTFEPVFDDQEA